ncbi:hypothetical protein ASF53_04020 [Methylobacterium sp. Leaf123]|nr:hypothetical protein ASF53_04020 [Methylobacterium sp. Leaf123]
MSGSCSRYLSDENFEAYLVGGRWSETADDNLADETISADFVRDLVETYNRAPEVHEAASGLGSLALMLGVAEWGVKGDGLPDDPARKSWRSDTGEDSGKHLMSYAVGGVGISHADVGDLEEFVEWIAASRIVPDDRKSALLRLAKVAYRKEGILYDELRAAGLCDQAPADHDLLGEPFQHLRGPVGTRYCKDYENGALKPDDWLTFRTWVRAALRTREAQAYLLDLWMRDYWQPTLAQVPAGEGAAEEMLINVRIRNSAPSVAKKAARSSPVEAGAAGRVQHQIDAYAHWKLKTARRRWEIMMRPVVLYRHFSGLDPLKGIHCD